MLVLEITNFTSTSLALLVAVFLVFIVYFALQRRGLPPGPTGVPYFGLLPYLDTQTAHLTLEKLKNKYGDIFSFTLTGRLFINLGSHAAAREALVTKADCFGSRIAAYSLFKDMFEHGIFYENGEAWKALRKFFLQTMKVRGVKAITSSLSGSLQDIISDTIHEIEKQSGEPVNIAVLMTTKCVSTLRLTLFGEEGLSDERLRLILNEYEIMMSVMTALNVLLVGKVTRYCILSRKSEYQAAVEAKKRMWKLLTEVIEEHKKTFNEHHIRDIIDDFIKERNERQRKGDPTAKHFTDEALIGSLVQLVGDGVLAVSFFASMMIKSLVEHPGEQEKIYDEMVDVVGHDRDPSLEDKPKLSRLNAFILEVLRMSDLFTVFPAMECTEETTLRGYRIPKGAILLMNMWCCHHDPDIYEEPQKFNPSRFICKDNKRRPELPLNFGVGKRSCLGEGLAMTELFLILSAIIKNFHLSLPNSVDSSLLFELLMSEKLLIYAKPRIRK